MAFTAKQHSQIALVYEKAAHDEKVPRQQRAAFARKANWFRMRARIAAKKEAAGARTDQSPELLLERANGHPIRHRGMADPA